MYEEIEHDCDGIIILVNRTFSPKNNAYVENIFFQGAKDLKGAPGEKPAAAAKPKKGEKARDLSSISIKSN